MAPVEITDQLLTLRTDRSILHPVGHAGSQLHLAVGTLSTRLSIILWIDVEAFYSKVNFFFDKNWESKMLAIGEILHIDVSVHLILLKEPVLQHAQPMGFVDIVM